MGSYLRFLNKKPFGKYAKKTSQPKVSFAKRVNALIARNVENKKHQLLKHFLLYVQLIQPEPLLGML